MSTQVGGLIGHLKGVRGMYYGWWLAGVAAFVMVLTTVPLFQGMTTWFVVLERNFNWSRTQITLALSLTRIEGSIMGPIGGYLIDKLGPRRMVFIGLLILGGGFILFSRIENLWMFYLAYMVMSVGHGFGGWLPVMTVLNNWFIRQRSTAMAVAMEGFSIGGIALVPLLVWAIDPDADRFGWRATAFTIGVVIMLVAFPVSMLVRNRPEDYGFHPDGRQTTPRAAVGTGPQQAASQAASDEPEYTWQQAIRTKTFWLITMGHSCSSIVIITLMVHLGPMLNIDRGLSLQTVGWVISVYTGVTAVFTLIGGYVGDRVPIRIAIFGFSAIQSVAVVIILFAHSAWMAFLFAIVMGIGLGGRTPLTTAIRGVYFGRRSFASITGVSMLPMNLMLLGAPQFAAYMVDTRGSYVIPFAIIAAISGLGSFLFLLLGDPTPAAAHSPQPRQVSEDRSGD